MRLSVCHVVCFDVCLAEHMTAVRHFWRLKPAVVLKNQVGEGVMTSLTGPTHTTFGLDPALLDRQAPRA